MTSDGPLTGGGPPPPRRESPFPSLLAVRTLVKTGAAETNEMPLPPLLVETTPEIVPRLPLKINTPSAPLLLATRSRTR